MTPLARAPRTPRAVCVAVLLGAMAAACSDKSGTGPGSTEDVDSYLRNLPNWSQYSPPVQDAPPAPVDGPSFARDTVPVDSTPTNTLGQYTIRQNVVYACESVPYSVTKTPQQLVMYSPNPAYLWPGAFIQGKSHRDGAGALLPVTIDERTPINVSIPGLPTGDNFRTVSPVNQAKVGSAIGEMIGNATADNLNTGSTSYFKVETFHSEEEFALGIGLSGRYLGWKARTQANTSTKGSQNVVSVQFSQRMYDVVVAPPQTPGGFFSPEFTEAKLQEQINLKRIGPDNPLVYVSKITYGRMMMFSMKSSASVSEMKGLIQASYSALGNNASATLTAREKNILNQSEIEIFSMGGADSATAAMIRSGDWRSYFTVSAPLSTAVPLSYELTNLSDGSTASVGETTSYTVRTCSELSQVPGQLQWLAGQDIAAPVPSPYDVRMGDVNGDQRQDLIWNHRSPTVNKVAVALASASGAFGSPSASDNTQPAPAEGWSNYDLSIGDVTGDGRADLIWNYRGAAGNKVLVARSQGTGFTFDAQATLSTSNFSPYKLFIADVTGDGADDLVWNALSSAGNTTYVGASNTDGTFTLGGPYTQSGGWAPYQMFTVDLNKDGRQDLIWSSIPGQNSGNRTYTALALAGGGFQFLGPRDHSAGCCWSTYRPLVADFDGDQVGDIYWNRLTPAPVYIHGFKGNGAGGWTQLSGGSMGNAMVNYAPATGDLNGDGRADMIWTSLGTSTAKIRVGLSGQNGLPVVSPVEQAHPATASFNLARQFVGRVDADSRDDVVFVIPEATTAVYVGVALP